MFSNLWISLEFTQTILTCQKDAILKIHCKYKCHIQIVYVLKNVDSLLDMYIRILEILQAI